jgi:predicted transcriptional regulator
MALPLVTPAAPLARATPAAAASASFGAVLRAQSSAPPLPASPSTHPARAMLESVERARARLDGLLAEARRGRTFTAQELLALQADAYRYSQAVEVASRVVEHGAQAVKQAVNTQV